MKKLNLLVLTAAITGLGCGTTDENNMCGDAGCPLDGLSQAVDAPPGFGLSSGTNDFNVTGISGAVDGCETLPGQQVGAPLPVKYDGAGNLSVGNVMGTPPTPSLGSGKIAGNKGTLTGENKVGDAAAECSYTRSVTSVVELIDHDKFTLAVTEKLSLFATKCTAAEIPPGGMCTSTWTWTMEKKK